MPLRGRSLLCNTEGLEAPTLEQQRASKKIEISREKKFAGWGI